MNNHSVIFLCIFTLTTSHTLLSAIDPNLPLLLHRSPPPQPYHMVQSGNMVIIYLPERDSSDSEEDRVKAK